ncbi:MAG: S9 family peptidase [Anaerolineae bacterium]|nr:S9 family peptidase [Anaerolineae bacterium]
MTTAKPQVAPYGEWKSPITSDLIASASIRLLEFVLDGETIYWIESRPTEGGRYVLVRHNADGSTTNITPAPFNVRTCVHEYGGRPALIDGGTVYFTNFADQRIYKQAGPDAAPQPLTPAVDIRHADFILDKARGRLIAVREDHTGEGEAVNTLAAVAIDGSGAQVLVSGNDFYSSPRLSPDGTRLAYLTWNHPNLPWDNVELWVAAVNADGSLGAATKVAGAGESIFQPEWSPDGVLYFVSDRSNWWNLYRWDGAQVEHVVAMEAEFGVPQWSFGMTAYAFESAERIICAYTQNGAWRLASLDINTRALTPIETPYTAIFNVRALPGRALFEGASPTEKNAFVALDLASGEIEILRRASTLEIDPGYVSIPEAIEFPTENGLTAYAFFYPPQNKDFTAPAGERPPLRVVSHGGPTGATYGALSAGVQYWTSRGFAILDVNYGGSTGYGRAYRQRLYGEWGVVDVDDCINGARYLVAQGRADDKRAVIQGGSAGGYTTLCALTFRDYFKAGASYFGLSELEFFVYDTHKFEARYLDQLIGPYPATKETYYNRSPINFVDQLSCPVIFLQGLEDKIVPPSQAEIMVEALRKKDIPVAYLPFEGEQHGFRRAENIKRALDAEFYFYAKVFGFEPADGIEPVEIENL